MATKKLKRKKRRTVPFIGMMLMVATTALSIYMIATTIILLCGMLPTMVAAFTDQDKEKTAGLTVGAMNFVGVLFILIELWHNNNTVDMATRLISTPSTWVFMYLPALLGYGLLFYLPPFVSIFLRKQMESKVEEAEDKQAKMIEEWGAEVSELAVRSASTGQ